LRHPPDLDRDGAIGQREVDVMVDDADRDLVARAIERLEQFLDDGRCKSLVNRPRPCGT